MIAVILSGHGAFASGIEQAVLQIIGEQSQFRAIDFPAERTTAELDQTMRTAMKDIDSGDGIVFLTDLLGGTPFRTASLISQERADVEVITGTNLQMAAEMLLERDELTLVEFREQALTCGHRGMTSLADELRSQPPQTQETTEDGI
ncbi:PTS galactosamine/N-acetylgalactosamine transporter subunit IIA [Photobacterium sp. TY1-4]|uniref:PTS galactosamine/N-acetylgalactosamine transporter subunit IIA n=1 Tax=Photobacterium sp. TY1-4 TaxID=2899122 RepID=UPI0021C1A18A|nr:PTS galactosamine/N-acetylgalactosamine transporter subunit IIA [Photobacterium sp. TY1-4]UXI04576.1 PTS galactosamine/N-acetylgalactosamine transporter subunit IIA [Photobacterium sp. TY1-4]